MRASVLRSQREFGVRADVRCGTDDPTPNSLAALGLLECTYPPTVLLVRVVLVCNGLNRTHYSNLHTNPAHNQRGVGFANAPQFEEFYYASRRHQQHRAIHAPRDHHQ